MSSIRNSLSFEQEGISPHSPVVQNLYLLGKILGTTPWDEKVMELTKVQSDLLVELYAMEHPELGIKVKDPDIRNETTVAHQLRAWANVLRGPTLKEFIKNPIAWLKKYHGG